MTSSAFHFLTACGKVGEPALHQRWVVPDFRAWGAQPYNMARVGIYLSREILFREIPVHCIPKGFDILGPSIPVIDVVGVFPDVTGENSLLALRHRNPGITRLNNGNGTVLILDKPCPSGTKKSHSLLGKLVFEIVE